MKEIFPLRFFLVFFGCLTSLSCVSAFDENCAERQSPSSQPIFLSTDTVGPRNKGYGVEGCEMTMLTVARPGRGMLCCWPGMC